MLTATIIVGLAGFAWLLGNVCIYGAERIPLRNLGITVLLLVVSIVLLGSS